MDFCFYLITDRKATGGRPVEDVIASAIDAGVRCVLLREKDLPDGELMELAGRVRDITSRQRVNMMVSSRVDVALAVGADGVHLSGTSLPVSVARSMLGAGKYLGVSTHSLDEAVEAESGGADFVTFGPVYYTASKAAYGEPVGVAALSEVCSRLKVPVFALGGVNADNTIEALGAGAYGIAAISAVMSASDPYLAAKGIINRIRDFKLKGIV